MRVERIVHEQSNSAKCDRGFKVLFSFQLELSGLFRGNQISWYIKVVLTHWKMGVSKVLGKLREIKGK